MRPTAKRGRKLSEMPKARLPLSVDDLFHVAQDLRDNTTITLEELRQNLGDGINTILSGDRDPVPADGKPDDFWINYVTWYIFGPKSSTNLWPAGVPLIGGGEGGDLPPGGPEGTVLTKQSNVSGDADWDYIDAEGGYF